MGASVSHSVARSSVLGQRIVDQRPVAAAGGAGVGGNTVAQLLQENCADMRASAGVVIEYLDTQAGTWQFSLDDGQTWRAVRTDLINRPGHTGLALDRDARLRVLCSGSNREGARVVFHSVQRGHGAGNGSYRPYAPDEREEASHSVALVLCMGAINGVPPAVKVPRPRNKRARAQGLDTASNAALSRA